MARCSPSTPMARVLRPCIVSSGYGSKTELIRMPDWFYRATPCMGQRSAAALRAMARCSPSTPMARVLRPCIASPAAATELLRKPDWFYRATPCMGRRLWRQRGLWHGVQSFAAASRRAATGRHSFRDQCHFDVAEQCHRVHLEIHHQPVSGGGLEPRFSRAGRRQRAVHGHQCHRRHSDVLPVKPVVAQSGARMGSPD